MCKKIEQILDEIRHEAGDKIFSGFNEEEYFLFHIDRYRFLLKMLNDFKKGKQKFLDIGASPYHLTIGAGKLGYDVFGLNSMGDEEESRKRKEKFNFIVKNCDLGKNYFPFENNFFDLILFSETLEHFNFHPLAVFCEIFRVLKPGGKVIITTPNLLRLNNRVKMFIGKSINWNIKDNFTAMTHWREYAAFEIICLFEEAELKIETVRYKNFDYPDINKWVKIIDGIATLFFPSLRGNLIIIAEK